jgi:hypothetical protein
MRTVRPTGRASGLAIGLVCAAALLIGLPARAADATATTPASKSGKGKHKTGHKAAKKKPATETQTADTPATKRRRVRAPAAYLVGDDNAHLINEDAPHVVAFGRDSKAVEKAFAENRRVELLDAEKAAREEKSPDRWRTVLFMLHGLPDNGDPEACFWRVLSFLRLGEIERARSVRAVCDLPAKDSSTLNAEDALVSGIPAMGSVARQDQWTSGNTKTGSKSGSANGSGTGSADDSAPDASVPPPPPPAAPYNGPGPTRYRD